MKESKTVVLDGDAILRVSKKLSEALEGESLPIVVQAFCMVIVQNTDFEQKETSQAQLIKNSIRNAS